MGIFSKLRRKKQAISLDTKNNSGLVIAIKSKKAVKLATEIVVPSGYRAIILCKERLCDEITEGSFKLSGIICPIACKINRLDKPTKKGYKTEFFADFYFVNVEQASITNEFFIKKLKTKINYSLEFKIENAKEFLKFLFLEKIMFENDFAKNELNFYVSQLIYYYYLDNKNTCFDEIKSYLSKKLKEIGVLVIDFNIFEKNKKLDNKISNESENNFEQNFNQNSVEKIADYNKNKTEQKDYCEEKNNNFEEKNNNYDGKNSFEIEDYDLDYSYKLGENYKLPDEGEISSFYGKNNKDFEKSGEKYAKIDENCKNFDENDEKSFSQETSLYDLKNIKNENITYFVCDRCGAKLAKGSEKCFMCKKSFKEEYFCENCGQKIDKTECVCPNCHCLIFR